MPTFKENLYAAMKPLFPETLIWADMSSPTPARPYSVMRVQSVKTLNMDHHSDVNSNGLISVTGDREFTLNIQRFQDYKAPEDVTSHLQAVVDKLRLRSHIDRLLSKGLAAYHSHAVQNISGLLDNTQIENRAMVDILVRYRSTQLDDVGLIETVNMRCTDEPEYTVIAAVA